MTGQQVAEITAVEPHSNRGRRGFTSAKRHTLGGTQRANDSIDCLAAHGRRSLSTTTTWIRKRKRPERCSFLLWIQVLCVFQRRYTNDLCAQRCPAHFPRGLARLLLPPWPRRADSRPGMDFQTAAVGGWPSCEGACRAIARPYLFGRRAALCLRVSGFRFVHFDRLFSEFSLDYYRLLPLFKFIINKFKFKLLKLRNVHSRTEISGQVRCLCNKSSTINVNCKFYTLNAIFEI